MKKLILFIVVLFTYFNGTAQDYLGLSTGNYSGVHGVLLQPASVADNRYRFDINLVSTSFNFQNNFIGLSRDYFINNRFSFNDFSSFEDFKSRVLTKNEITGNNAYLNINNRLNLPSILLSTGKKSGIAFNLQSRTSLAFNNINPELLEQAYEGWDFQPTMNQTYDASGLNLTALNWVEAGLTYGRVLVDKKKHFFKAGVTGKYLGGVSSWYFKADELNVRATSDSFISVQSPYIQYGHSETNISSQISTDYRPDASSFGYDIGLVYEFRGRFDKFNFLKFNRKSEEIVNSTRRDKNKYTLKVGVSLLDVGVLNFQSTPLARDFSSNVNGFNLYSMNVNNVQDFDTLLSSLQGVGFQGAVGEEYSVAMPTSLNAQVDWHLFKGFYINAMANMPFTALNKNTDYRVFTPEYYAVTPRWESRMAGVYVPLMLNKFDNAENQITAGATVRLGPLFVGTSNLLTLVRKDNIRSADLHAGLKLPLAFGKPSKASRWFKDFTNDKEETIETKTVEKTVIVKDAEGNDVEKKVIVEEKVEKESPAQNAQPIQIIINNYGGGNNQPYNKRQIIDVNTDSSSVKQKTVIVDENGNEIDVKYQDNVEIYNLQDQIEYLKFKLKQKEELIDELDKQKSNLENGSLIEEGKKKIKSLTESFLEGDGYNSSVQLDTNMYSAVFLRAKVFELQKELLDLGAKNERLDNRIKNIQSATDALTIEDASDVKKDNLQDINTVLYQLQTANPKRYESKYETVSAYTHPSYDYSYKPVGVQTEIVDLPKDNFPIRTDNQVIQSYPVKQTPVINYNMDTTNIMTKTDAQNLMTKSEYQNLRKELALLKEELKQSAQNNKPRRRWSLFGGRNKTVVNVDSSRNVMQEVKLLRDTIYIERPVEKIVTKIVRDTITNTIEKNNIITKTETKIKTIDNTVRDLVSLPPLFVLFDVGKFSIKPIYYSKLTYYANEIKKHPELKVQLTGHTDASGNAAKNLILSKNRAKAVSNYLVRKGLSRDKIVLTGLGSDDPLADNQTKSGKSQNRRVELIFIK